MNLVRELPPTMGLDTANLPPLLPVTIPNQSQHAIQAHCLNYDITMETFLQNILPAFLTSPAVTDLLWRHHLAAHAGQIDQAIVKVETLLFTHRSIKARSAA